MKKSPLLRQRVMGNDIIGSGRMNMNDMNKEMRMILYCADDTDVAVNAIIKDETIWITQKAMADLFDVNPPAISKHLKKIFSEGELEEAVVVSKMEMTTEENSAVEKKKPAGQYRQGISLT